MDVPRRVAASEQQKPRPYPREFGLLARAVVAWSPIARLLVEKDALMGGRSPVVSIAIGAVAAAGLLTLWSQRAPAPAAAPVAVARQFGAPAITTRVTDSRAERALPVAPKQVQPRRLTPAEGLRELEAEAKRLEALARYPRWSQPLNLLGDELAEQYALHIQTSDEDAGQPVLAVYTDHRTFESPEPVRLRAHLSTQYGPVFANLSASVLDGTGQLVTELHFSRDGLEYVSSFVPPAPTSASSAYSIRVSALGPNQERRDTLLEIVYNQSLARLTGNFRDRLDNGNLLIEAEVSVQHAGEFALSGSLYGAAAKQQIAWAEASAKLAEGSNWVPLKFHGLILREQQVDGPYLLRYVALTAQTADAAVTTRPLRDAYTTQSYVADAFEGEPHRDSQWLAEAALLREHMEHMREEWQ
jgi:hypothetical protein